MIETPSLVDLLASRSLLGKIRHGNLADSAETAFSEMYQRWSDLDAWDARNKLPQIVKPIARADGGQDPSIAATWDAFKVRWNDNPDIGELQAAGDDLHVVEGYAADAGYNAGKAPPQVQVPDVTSGTGTTSAAETVNEGAIAAQKAAESAAHELAAAPGSFFSAIPLWLKLTLAGGAIVAVASTVKR